MYGRQRVSIKYQPVNNAALLTKWIRSAQKGGFFHVAASQGIAILFPDTSPRGAGVEGEDNDWDFGTGAGFYLDATNSKYSKHYNMATHITVELPQVIEAAEIPIVCLQLLPLRIHIKNIQ